jgi:hypothetical protein
VGLAIVQASYQHECRVSRDDMPLSVTSPVFHRLPTYCGVAANNRSRPTPEIPVLIATLPFFWQGRILLILIAV